MTTGPFGYKQANPFGGDLDSLYAAKAALWAPYYHNRQTQLGATVTILNFGDRSNWGLESAATGTGKKFSATGLSPVWTPSEALSAFDTAFDLTQPSNWQGIAPVLTLNGTDEEMDTPDDTYFSRGDGVNDSAFSLGLWVYITGTGEMVFLGKWGASLEEWLVDLNGTTRLLQMILHDDSAALSPNRTTDAAIAALNTWTQVIITYAGTGGATAANGITIYANGAVAASTANNQALYVAMENSTRLPSFGFANATSYLQGKVAGGPFGPFFGQAELTAAQVANLYQVERLGLGV